MDFSPDAVDIRLGLQETGARFLPDNGNCRDGVAVLQQFVHALLHVVWQRSRSAGSTQEPSGHITGAIL